MYLVGVVWFSVDVFFVVTALDAPKKSIDALWAASGAGGLLGGLAAFAAQRRSSWRIMLPAGLAVKGAAVLWYALSTDYAWAMAAVCLWVRRFASRSGRGKRDDAELPAGRPWGA